VNTSYWVIIPPLIHAFFDDDDDDDDDNDDDDVLFPGDSSWRMWLLVFTVSWQEEQMSCAWSLSSSAAAGCQTGLFASVSTKFSENVGSPLYFPTPVSDCLWHVSFRRYSPLNLEVIEKRSKCKSLLALTFVGGTAPTFIRRFVRATYYPLTHY